MHDRDALYNSGAHSQVRDSICSVWWNRIYGFKCELGGLRLDAERWGTGHDDRGGQVRAILIFALLGIATSMLKVPVEVIVWDQSRHKQMPNCDYDNCRHDLVNTLWRI